MSDSPLTHAREKLAEWRHTQHVTCRILPTRDNRCLLCKETDDLLALLADTRAATEGSENEQTSELARLEQQVNDIEAEGPGPHWIGMDTRAVRQLIAWSRKSAASTPTRETGWLQLLREYGRHADGCSAAHGDQYRCRCGWRDVLASLPTPPRDERPQTGEETR